MAFESRSLDDYIDVATRIAEFRDKYPHGSLRPLDPAEPYKIVQVQGFDKAGEVVTQTFISVTAAAYRDPDDGVPGVGMAWEVFPGRTPYTRGSELMNAETSAWGRAIIAALASDSRAGVASREEVRNREAEREAEKTSRVKPADLERERELGDPWAGTSSPVPVETESHPGSVSPQQLRVIQAILTRLGVKDTDSRRAAVAELIGRDIDSSKELSFTEAGRVLKALREREAAQAVSNHAGT